MYYIKHQQYIIVKSKKFEYDESPLVVNYLAVGILYTSIHILI
jgi:hypothetical protein